MVNEVQLKRRFPVEPSTSNDMASIQSAQGNKIPRRPEIELLVYGARTSLSAAAKNRIGELLRENLNWNEVIGMAARHAVVPLLYRNLNVCSYLVPAEVLERLRVLTLRTSIQNLNLAAELSRLVKMMERNGIASLPFKGPVLAISAYGDLSLRQFSDLDIVIRKKDVQKAKELFVERGYLPLGDRTPEQDEVFLKARRPYNYKFISANGQVRVELHWEFTSRYNSFSVNYEALFERLIPVEFAGHQVLQLKPEDLILFLCQHGSKHFWDRLLWLIDIVEVIRTYSALDWKKTISQAESMGARRMLFLGLHLAERLLDLELPVEVSKRIRKEPKIKSLSARIEEQLFLESRYIQGFEMHTFSCSMRERLRDKLRYSGYRVLHWLTQATTPTEKDRGALPQGLSFSPLAYIIRPVRLLGGGAFKFAKPVAKESRSDIGPDQDASLENISSSELRNDDGRLAQFGPQARAKRPGWSDGPKGSYVNSKLMRAKTDLEKQVAFYDQRWSGFAYANRRKMARCVSILNALQSTRLLEPRIIDLGCGAGWLAGIVGNFGPTTGVDLSHQAVAEAAVRYPYVQFIQADILSWKYPENSFDLVISQEIIEHVDDQKGYIEVAYGLLREGGYLVLTTPNARTMHAMTAETRKAWSNQPIENWLTIDELRALLAKRFEITSLTTIMLNVGGKGLYRVFNSCRLRSFLARLGFSEMFDTLRGWFGYGLHIVVLAKKIA